MTVTVTPDARVVACVLAVLERFPTGLTFHQITFYVSSVTHPILDALVRGGHVTAESRVINGGHTTEVYSLTRRDA